MSDEETIAWNIATELGTPVFNGGRAPQKLTKLVGNPRLNEVKIIIEILGEHHFNKNIAECNDFTFDEFQTYTVKKEYKNYLKIHPKRFFLPLKLIQKCCVKERLVNEFKRKKLFDDYAVPLKVRYSTVLKEEDFQQAIENIAKRASILKSLGYEYIFAMTPKKNLQLGKYFHHQELDQHERIAQELRAHNVHYVDIYKAFMEYGDPHDLYFKTDCHINENGAKLMAEKISEYLRAHSDLSLLCNLSLCTAPV